MTIMSLVVTYVGLNFKSIKNIYIILILIHLTQIIITSAMEKPVTSGGWRWLYPLEISYRWEGKTLYIVSYSIFLHMTSIKHRIAS